MDAKKKNDYGWNLDSVAHGTAHLSKNWTKDKQKEYNHWYYINKIKKDVKNAITGEDYLAEAKNQQNQSNLNYDRGQTMDILSDKYRKEAGAQTKNIEDASFNKALSSYYYKDRVNNGGSRKLDQDTYYVSAVDGKVKTVDSPNKAGKKYRAAVEEKNRLKKKSSDYYKQGKAYRETAKANSKAAQTAINNYKTKSLKGISEQAIKSGKSAVDDILSSVSSKVSNFTSKKKTVTSGPSSNMKTTKTNRTGPTTKGKKITTWDDATTTFEDSTKYYK